MSSRRRLATILLPALMTLAACKGGENSRASSDAAAAIAIGNAFRMRPVAVRDSAAGNQTAFTMLVPSGWNHRASVVWNPQFANLASASVEMEQVQGAGKLQVYPVVPYVWLESTLKLFSIGSISMGGMVQKPVSGPAEYIKGFLLPVYRAGITNVTVVTDDSLPGIAEQVWHDAYNADRKIRITAGRIQIRYEQGGSAFEEAFYCVLSFAVNPQVEGNVIWRPELIYSIGERAGALAKVEPLLTAVVSSISADRGWFSHYLAERREWEKGQMQSIRNAGEMSRYISQSNDEISTFFISTYKSQQPSLNRIHNLFSGTVRGVETYTNPYSGNPVQLPSDFGSVWVSSSGEYLLAKGAEFDKLLEGSRQWKPMGAAP